MRNIQTILLVVAFSIAFAFVESAVVVYIRELYYPEGFDFPLKLMAFHIILTELFRELSTLIILLSIGILAGRNFAEKLAYFIMSFAIWDIFYYVFLKALINWPDSLLTWDILFFIPTTWVGPVLAPLINSITMIIMAVVIIILTKRGIKVKFNLTIWLLLIVGSLVTIIGYTEEYSRFMMAKFSFSEIFGSAAKEELLNHAIKFVPEYFNWYIFGIGELLFFVAIYLIIRQNYRNLKVNPQTRNPHTRNPQTRNQ